MAEIGPTTASQIAQGRVQESPAAEPGARVILFPQMPGRNSAQTETRTSSRTPYAVPDKATWATPTGGVTLGFVGGTVIQLVAEQQQGSGASPNRADRLRAVAAYAIAREVGTPPRTADGGEPIVRSGESLDFLT